MVLLLRQGERMGGWGPKPVCWPNHWAVYDIIAAAMRDLKYMNQDDEATMRAKLTRGGGMGELHWVK